MAGIIILANNNYGYCLIVIICTVQHDITKKSLLYYLDENLFCDHQIYLFGNTIATIAIFYLGCVLVNNSTEEPACLYKLRIKLLHISIVQEQS